MLSYFRFTFRATAFEHHIMRYLKCEEGGGGALRGTGNIVSTSPWNSKTNSDVNSSSQSQHSSSRPKQVTMGLAVLCCQTTYKHRVQELIVTQRQRCSICEMVQRHVCVWDLQRADYINTSCGRSPLLARPRNLRHCTHWPPWLEQRLYRGLTSNTFLSVNKVPVQMR